MVAGWKRIIFAWHIGFCNGAREAYENPKNHPKFEKRVLLKLQKTSFKESIRFNHMSSTAVPNSPNTSVRKNKPNNRRRGKKKTAAFKQVDKRTNLAWYPLVIHPQTDPHEEIVIAGTVEGLIALRSVIDGALTSGENTAGATFDPGDGEGYVIHVAVMSNKEIEKQGRSNYIGNPAYSKEDTRNANELRDKVISKTTNQVLDVEVVKKSLGLDS